jgi:hypothetical protein
MVLGASLALGASTAACFSALGLGDFSFGGDASLGDSGGDSCLDPKNNCYACTPQTTEQYLNSCGSGCIPFDSTRLKGLLLDGGGLPPLPPLIDDGGTQ